MIQADTAADANAAAHSGTQIHSVGFDAPFRWLRKGWDDFRATGYRGALYGLVFALMGMAIMAIYATRWQLTMGLTAGFFLLGPFVCTGLYELSRQRERGEPIDLVGSMTCWKRNLGSIAFFAALLTLMMVFWARTSIVIFALFSSTGLPTLQGVLAQVFSMENWEFIGVWAGVGLVFASLAFSVSVVSVPMMLDRRSDTMTAIFASVRALFHNTGPVYLWAALIVALIGVSLLFWFVLLIVTAPVIGHATWHAYREMVGTSPDSAG
jgi:uncharacterized membrane protein